MNGGLVGFHVHRVRPSLFVGSAILASNVVTCVLAPLLTMRGAPFVPRDLKMRTLKGRLSLFSYWHSVSRREASLSTDPISDRWDGRNTAWRLSVLVVREYLVPVVTMI